MLLAEHLRYVSDPIRMAAFQAAVARVVKPGDVVVDLGCGTGVLGLLCLRAGARRVFAIDKGPMLETARETVARAGLRGRVVFLAGLSLQLEIPEPADVIVCDQVGFFGFDAGIVGYLDDARKRFLRPGGTMIPSGIEMQVAPVESERCQALVEDWRSDVVPQEIRWLRERAVHSKHAVELRRDELLGAAAAIGSIDLRAPSVPFYAWTTELRIERGGSFHGLGGWFDCTLADGVRMTNAPTSERAIRRAQAFLPINEPVTVTRGDVVAVRVTARPADHVISWDVSVRGSRFTHSTFLGELLDAADVAKRDPTHVPRLTPQSTARSVVLSYCDGVRTLADIEAAVLREHPSLFPSPEETVRFVARVLGKDTC